MSTKMRMAIIAGADAALKYKKQKPGAPDDEVMKHIAETAGNILAGIDVEG